jgi:hypothetical protein
MRVMLSISTEFSNRIQYILIVISLVGNIPSYLCVDVTRLKVFTLKFKRSRYKTGMEFCIISRKIYQ